MRSNKLTPKTIRINFPMLFVLVFSFTLFTGMSGGCDKNGEYKCKECNAKYSSGYPVPDSKRTVCNQQEEQQYRTDYNYATVECKE
jgi:hypothetical protein